MSAPPVGTRVTEGTRCGTVVAHRPQGMVDVNFDDLSYPIRRPATNLVVLRGNPFPARRNPAAKPVFLCAVLTPASRHALYKWWMSQPLAPEPLAIHRATHMTIKFKPSDAEFDAAAIGKEVTLSVIGWVANPDIQAVAVTPNGVTSTKAHPHVTFALREPSIPAKLSDSILDGTVKGMVQAARGPALVAHIGWSDGKGYHTTREPLSNPGPRGGLSPRERASLPDSAFALPGRRWPIPDRNHAQIAKTYMARGFGRHTDYPQIRRAIAERFQMNPASSEAYDPTKEQFRAVVQGVYESLVSKELGIRRPEPFVLADGTRPDARLAPDTRRRLLSSAYAIATRQGQKHGWLQEGTQTPTARGVIASAVRARDEHHASTNRQDYEQTLGAVRKSGHFRVVQEQVGSSTRFVVQPRPTHVRIPEYRMTLEAAQRDADTANGSFTRWNPRHVRMRRNPDPTPRDYYVSTLRAFVRSISATSNANFPAGRYGCTDADLDATHTALSYTLLARAGQSVFDDSYYLELCKTKNKILRKHLKIDATPSDTKPAEVRVKSNLRDLFHPTTDANTGVVFVPYLHAKLKPDSFEAVLLRPVALWLEYITQWWELHARLWLRPLKALSLLPAVRYCMPGDIDAEAKAIDAWIKCEQEIRAALGRWNPRFGWAKGLEEADILPFLADNTNLEDAVKKRRGTAVQALSDEAAKDLPVTEIDHRRFAQTPKDDSLFRVTLLDGNPNPTPRTCLRSGLKEYLDHLGLNVPLNIPHQVNKLKRQKQVRVEMFTLTNHQDVVLNVPLRSAAHVIEYSNLHVVNRLTGKAAGPEDGRDAVAVVLDAGRNVFGRVMEKLGETESNVSPTIHVQTFVLGAPQLVKGIGAAVKQLPPDARTDTQDRAQDKTAAVSEATKMLRSQIPDDDKSAYYDIEQVFTISYPEDTGSGIRTQYRTIALRPGETREDAFKRVSNSLLKIGRPPLPDKVDAHDVEIRYVIYIRRDRRFIPRLAKFGRFTALASESRTRGHVRVGRGDAPGPGQGDHAPPTNRKAGRRVDTSYTTAGVASHGAVGDVEVVYPSMLLKRFFTVDPQQLQDEETFLETLGVKTDPTADVGKDEGVPGLDDLLAQPALQETDAQTSADMAAALSHRFTMMQKLAKTEDTKGRWVRASPDNNWVPYRSKINEQRRAAQGEWNDMTGQYEKKTLYKNPYDVFFTKSAGLAYLTILFFKNPRALQSFETDLVEAARIKAGIPENPLAKAAFAASELFRSYEPSDRERAREALESRYSEALPPSSSLSVEPQVAEKTELGKLFIFGLAEGVKRSLAESLKPRNSSVFPKNTDLRTIEAQRTQRLALPAPPIPAPPAEAPALPEQPAFLAIPALDQAALNDLCDNPRRPTRRFR